MQDEEINLLDYWRVILRWKNVIAGIVIAVTISTLLYSLFLPKIYKAEATILPIGGNKGGMGLSAIAAQAGLGGLLGGVGGGGSSSSSQIMVILQSRTMSEKIIERFGLLKVLYPKEWETQTGQWKNAQRLPLMIEDTVKSLGSIATFMDDKKTMALKISVELQDPKLAADVVNGYLEELANFINSNTLTAAKSNRIFIEKQLERNRAELLESGKELSDFYAINQISNVIPKVDVDVSIKGLKGTSKTTGELEEIQKNLDDLNSKINQARIVKDVPQQVYLQYLTLRRELLGQTNSLLTQQYEMAKIDEAKEDINFQIIDSARVPIRKFKPHKAQIVIMGFILSLFLGIFYAFFREYLEKMKNSG